MRRMLATSVLVFVLLADLFGQLSPSTPAWGNVDHGLRLGIVATVRSGGGIAFEITVENVGRDDFVLRLGNMLSNGKVMWPEAIRLVVTDAAGAATKLGFFDRRYGIVAGRLDDFLVALRAGSRYTLVTTLADYPNFAANDPRVRLTAGRHRVKAVLEGRGAASLNLDTQGIALLNYWLGTLESGLSEFQVP